MENKEDLELKEAILRSWIRELEENKIITDKEKNVLLKYLSQSKVLPKNLKTRPIKYNKIRKICDKIGKSSQYSLVSNSYYNLERRVKKYYSEDVRDYVKRRIEFLAKGNENIGIFTRNFLEDVKSSYQNELNKAKLSKTQTSRKVLETKITSNYEDKINTDKLKKVQEDEANDYQKVEEKLRKEKELFKNALKEGSMKNFKLEPAYTIDEEQRQQYVTDFLDIAIRHKEMLKQGKKYFSNKLLSMDFIASKLEELMTVQVLGMNYNTRLNERTLGIYEPYKLFEMYSKQYEIMSKEFYKLSSKDQAKYREKFKNLPKPIDILNKVNDKAEDSMIKFKLGVSTRIPNIDYETICRRTKYMDVQRIAKIMNIIDVKEAEDWHKYRRCYC